MPQKVAVLNVVGLSGSLLEHAPRIRVLGEQATLTPVLPAVTCSVQSSMLTGRPVRAHGVVGNGWFNYEQQEIQFWKQSNKLVGGEKVWETAKQRDPSATCLNSFWWYNMYSSVDYSITPRPQYKADGRKIPDCYTHPASLRDELQVRLGQFPLFKFWGPMAGIESTRWIAEATKHSVAKFDPTLTLVYLPHLDYGLQKLGPGHADIPQHVKDIDDVAGDLIDFFHQRDTKVIVVSEYGIEPATGHIDINRRLREQGFYAGRSEPNLLQWLDLVALGTVCDVVPLRGLNRAFVAQGLKVISARTSVGLASLAEAAGAAGPATAYHVG
ncbi:MAG: alkaline phosphatase family protein, partial [Planctomycetota bacterium]